MFRRLATALSAAMVFGCAAQAAPLELYGRLPTIEDVAISPNGGRIAYVLTKGEERTVAIESLPDRQPVMIAPAGAAKVRGLTWAGDGHLLITASTAKKARDVTGPRREWFMAFDLDLAKRSITSLMQFTGETDAMNVIFGMPEVRTIDGKPFAFVRGEHFVGNQGQFGLFKVDLDTHVSKLVEEGHRGDAYDWIIDPNGVAVAEATYNDRTGWWALLVKDRDREWRRVHTVKAAIETPELVSLGRDGRSILIDVYDETLGTGWRELSMDGGAWGDPIPGEGERGAIVDPADGRLIGSTALVSEETVYTFFDAQDAAVWRAVQKAFPSDLVTLVSWSDDRKKIVVRVDSPQLGPAYALVDLNTGEAIWLGAEYSGMREADISPVKPVRYKAADGLEITGYLTLPRGRDPRGLPLVVLAHGGPASRDAPGFDWWPQALASRGYAVLQANFRGSSGFGGEFMSAGFGEWGRKMQTDLSDGVKDLARSGVIDPKRVCIVGASYGGYAALAGATLERGVYRCAVSYGGVSDLRNLIIDGARKSGRGAQRYWQRFIGVENLQDPVLAKLSPTANAAAADIPILLIHGRDDTVVPITQSQQMADALRKAGKSVELVELKGEDHWLSRGDTRLAMLQATVDFLEKNNPPK